MGKLSHKLINLRFFSALGTSEDGKAENHVKRGKPYTHDSNNGVMVVYDEAGRPWIVRTGRDDAFWREFDAMKRLHDLQHGAYVPHSNDGGYFVDQIMDKI